MREYVRILALFNYRNYFLLLSSEWVVSWFCLDTLHGKNLFHNDVLSESTRDVFYVRRMVDLMKTAKVNAYIMHIFGKIELLSIHAT